jgi:biotin transport system substrate-specific component
LVALNLPIDTNLAGAAALSGATAGYLVGFIPAAFVTGWLAEHGANRVWQRWLAGIVGVVVIYAFGVTVLRAVTGMTWSEAFAAGIAPFVMIDLIKAVIAAGLSETGRAALLRWLPKP